MSIKTLFRWHLWFGLVSGACMFVIGLTGALAVFAEEIDWLVIPPLRVDAPAGATHLDFESIVAKVQAAYPASRVGSINLSVRPAFAHVAAVQVRRDGRNQRIDAYVNPFTGAVQGERLVGNGYFSSTYQFLRQTHVRLLLGLWGRVFVGVCGVSLVLSCITGLWIYRGWIRKMFQLRLGGGWGNRAPWAELHKFVGVWSLAFNVVLGLTGAVLGLENLVNQVESKWLKPAKAKVAAAAVADGEPAAAEAKPAAAVPAGRRRTAPPPADTPMLPFNTLLAKAHAAFPDLTPRTVTLPSRPGASFSIRGEVPSWLVAQSHVRSANGIVLNSATGEVINQADGRKTTGWTRLYWMIDPLHFGYFGGMPTKILWFILGLSPSLLSLTGAWMWWRRRSRATAPKPAPAAAGPAPGATKWITRAAIVLTLVASYAIVARTFHRWNFDLRFAEFWLVKPIALVLVAFPVTGLLAWLAVRARAQTWLYAGTCALLSGWYLLLTGILMT